MSVKSKLVWIGLAAVLATPFLPMSDVPLLQGLAAAVLLLVLGVTVVARTPFRALLALVRLLLTAIAVACVVIGFRIVHFNPFGLSSALAFDVAGGFVGLFALEPSLPERYARWVIRLFRAAVVWTVVMWILGRLGLHFHFATYLIWPSTAFVANRRKGKDCSPTRVTESLVLIQEGAQRWLGQLESDEPNGGISGRFLRSRLNGALWRLSSSGASPEEMFGRLIDLAKRYPRVELGWRLAYSAAVGRRDWQASNSLVRQAAQHGFRLGDSTASVVPAVAERFGDRGNGFLADNDLRTILAQASHGPNAVVEDWRVNDRQFVYWEQRLATGA